jgi:hypothetical protein
MDIEELSKAQLLLLTVMVNFVVSIATGVLTVSLLDQAPVQISQGVDRVVERTIESIATPVQVVNPIKSITSAVTDNDEPAPNPDQLTTAAVGNALSRTVLIHRNSTSTPALAFGTYLPKSRAVVTVAAQGLPREALIVFSDGSSQRASLSKTSGQLAIYGFADDAKLPGAPDAGLVASSKLKQGQTVLALTKDSAAVTGIISKVGTGGIETSLPVIPAGAGAVGLDGLVVGIGSNTPGLLIPADTVTTLLQAPVTKK